MPYSPLLLFSNTLQKASYKGNTLATRSLLHCVTIFVPKKPVVVYSVWITSSAPCRYRQLGHRWMLHAMYFPHRRRWTDHVGPAVCVTFGTPISKIHISSEDTSTPAMSRLQFTIVGRSTGIISPRMDLLQVVDWAKGPIGGYSNKRGPNQFFLAGIWE
jgi:hypothetical protein